MNLNCDQCGRTFEVPDERAGEAVDCPGCNASVVPGGSALCLTLVGKEPEQPAEPSLPDPREEESEESSEDQSVLKISCPNCDQPLEVPIVLIGRVIDCPSCSGKIEVTKRGGVSVAQDDILTECPSCQQRIAAPAEYAGQTVNCPGCTFEIVVPDETSNEKISAEIEPEFEDESLKVHYASSRSIIAANRPTFWQLIGRAFMLDGHTCACVAIILGVEIGSWVLMFFLIMGCVTIPLAIVAMIAYPSWLFTYFKSIIRQASEGEARLPEFPDLEDKTEVFFVGFGQLLAIAIIGGFPLFAGIGIANYPEIISPLFIGLAVSGFIIPILTFFVAMFDSVTGMFRFNFIFRGLKQFFGQYIVIVIITTGVLFIADWISGAALGALILVGFLVTTYARIVVCRMLGFLYYANSKELRWLGEKRF